MKHVVQCAKCPWKKSTNPFDIPDGYDEMLHKNLSCTIAKEENEFNPNLIRAMACHKSSIKEPYFCIGWLSNQLGQGNNIPLRIHMRNYTNLSQLRVVGEQHSNFQDTLPRKDLLQG